MPPARRTGRQAQQPRPTWASPALALLGVLVGLGLWWFGYPGAVPLWIFTVVAAWVMPPALFTGKKDASGFPTAAHPGETRSMQHYRFWADLKWHLLFPTNALLPGWPVYASWLYGVWAAAVVWCLPHADVPYAGMIPRHVDAVLAFMLVAQVAAARRRTVVAGDVSPGVRVDAIKSIKAASTRDVLAGLLAAVLGAATCAWVAAATLPTPPLPLFDTAAWYVLGGVGGFGAGLAYWWVKSALTPWRILVAARAEWAPRWQMLKHDPAPTVIARDQVGNATVDTFIAPGSLGAMAYWPLAPKITPTMGAGQRIAVLSTPNTDSKGQPQPGTRHPLQFQVVSWAADAMPDITALDGDLDEVRLFIQCAMIWACDAEGYARPILDEVVPLALTEAPAPEASADDQDPDAPVGDAPAGDAPQTSARQAWATTWLLPDGPPMKYVRNALAPGISGNLGVEVLVDHRSERVYAGGLTDGSTTFDPSTGVDGNTLLALAIEDTWNGRWAEVLKQDVNPPTIQHETYAEAQLANGKTVHRQAFVTLRGVDPMDFFGLEAKIKATLDAAPYVAVCGWPSPSGRHGERHPQAFSVYWSADAAPPNPDTLAPTGAQKEVAAQWVLSGRMNEAFKAARLAAPEVYEVKCLTQPRARGHIWQMKIRLYGGVTLADVRGASQRLRQALGSSWLRVEAVADGCIIVAGVEPAKARLVNPGRDQRYLASLDWEQAFLDAKVSGVGGLVPSLTAVDRLPNNEQVQVLDFTLPSGLSMVDVKAKTKALESSSRNAFVEVRRAPSGKADEVRFLASEVNPMPERAAFDFDRADPSGKDSHRIPFATNLFGEPTTYDNAVDPHLLISGTSGGGKSVALQNFIYGALVRDWDLWVVDPSKGAVDFGFAEPYARAVGRTVWEAKGIIAAIYNEVLHRKAINQAHACGNYRDLPDKVRYNHVLIVLDEFTSMMMPEPLPKALDDSPETIAALESAKALNAARAFIGTYVGKIVREARSTGFTMILATQALKADTIAKIPGANDLKDNLSRMVVGRASFAQLMAALKMPTEVPDQPEAMPPGRGLYEGNGRASEAIQCWFEGSQAVFAENLSQRIAPLTAEQRLDLSEFVEPEPEGFGSRLDGEPSAPGRPNPPTSAPVVKDLGVVELSLDDLVAAADDTDDTDDDDTKDQGGQPAAPGAFDWDALQAQAETADTTDEEGLDWSTDAAAAAAGPTEPAGGEGAADEDVVTIDEHVPWHEIDPSHWLPETSRYGWTEIDALMAFLVDFPETRTVSWEDPHLDQAGPHGVNTLRDMVTALLKSRGVEMVAEPLAPAAGVPVVEEQQVHVPTPDATHPVVPAAVIEVADLDDEDDLDDVEDFPAAYVAPVDDEDDLEEVDDLAPADEPADDPVDLLDLDAFDLTPWAPVTSEYGWDAVDALVAFLDSHTVVRSVRWTDARLDEEDEMGIAFRDIVLDLLASRDVTLAEVRPTTEQPAVSAPALDPAQTQAPESVVAPVHRPTASLSDEFDDLDALPKVPAHLLPDDDDPFA